MPCGEKDSYAGSVSGEEIMIHETDGVDIRYLNSSVWRIHLLNRITAEEREIQTLRALSEQSLKGRVVRTYIT
jgi:hypothetical protein